MSQLLRPSLRLRLERPVLLVVDDYAPLRDALMRMFRNDYFDIATAPSGNVAKRWLTDWATGENDGAAFYDHPVIVLSDVDMDDGDGFELAEWCADNGVPIVLWSGASGDAGELHKKTAVAMGLGAGPMLKGNFMGIRSAIRRAEEIAGITR